MKKNYLLGMFAVAGMLMATSCSNNELEVAQLGNEAQVTFSLGLENGIGSRTISDGTKADKLVYAVYKINSTTGVAELQKVVNSDENGQFIKGDFKSGDNVSVTLAKGQTYQVAFWAQDSDCNAYTTTDLTNVQVDYENAANNDELSDAFFKTVEFKVMGNQTIDVVLKRPFAQINVGVYKTDWEAAVASGIEIEKSTVTIENAAASVNLLTGAVGPETTDVTVTYSSAAIPTEELKVDHNEDDDFDDENERYAWLSMSYILVADHDDTKDENGLLGTDQTTLTGLTYTFTPKSGHALEFKEGLNGVPVRRNWRTNILGKILTGDIDFKVTIDPVYDGDIVYPEASELEQQLRMVATFGGTITLTNNVQLEAPLTVGADMILNLGDYTITNPTGYVIENTGNLTISGNKGSFNGLGGIRSTGGQITINGGKYTASSKWDGNPKTYQHILKAENTEVVINGGTFDATIGGTNNAMINVSKGSTVTINGGEFRNVPIGTDIPQFAPYMFTYEKDGKLIINGGDFYGGWRFNGETATTDIYGGNFTVSYDGQSFHANSTHVLTIYGGTFSTNNGGKLNPANYLAEGCYALEYEDGVYTIQKFDAASRTLTINSKEELLKLSTLNEKWVEFFSDGKGTEYSNYAEQNGGKGIDFYYKWDWTIKLNADIDLDNKTFNTPINLSGFGNFNGQNYTIKNVKIITATNEKTDAGLFIASSHAAIKNLKLDNVHVTGSFVGNSTAGILASDCNSAIDNITITNSSVVGGKYTGGVVGYGYTDITDCTLTNCTVKGGYKLGGVIGYICSSGVERIVEGNTLTDCEVAYAGTPAEGKTEADLIIGKLVGNFNCNGICKDNLIENMTTSAIANIGKIEAGMVVAGQNTTVVSLPSDLNNALADGDNVVIANDIKVSSSETGSNSYGANGISQLNGGVIDGNGNDVSVDAWGTWDSAINTTGGTIKNVNVTGGFRGIFVNNNSANSSKVILENVTIDGTVYTISCDQGTNKGLEAYNSTFNGWTSYAATIGDVKFVECKFGEGQGYAFCRPYASTEFIECEFAAGFQLDAVASVAFKNCTIGGVALTNDNLAALVTSGIANATVK